MAPGLPGDGAYSIRHSLQGALEDFVRASGFSCVHLEGLIREFVGMLAAYREEDTPLYPEVFVFASQDGLTALAPSGAPRSWVCAPERGCCLTHTKARCSPRHARLGNIRGKGR